MFDDCLLVKGLKIFSMCSPNLDLYLSIYFRMNHDGVSKCTCMKLIMSGYLLIKTQLSKLFAVSIYEKKIHAFLNIPADLFRPNRTHKPI